MKERPIIFSGPMIPPILAGTKTQTRRIVKPRADRDFGPRCVLQPHEIAGEIKAANLRNSVYGVPGDRLRVKESAWMWCERRPNGLTKTGRSRWRYVPLRSAPVHYATDWPWPPTVAVVSPDTGNTWGWRLKIARFLPAWASRITLEITDVRVERLQDISEADAKCEGVIPYMPGEGAIRRPKSPDAYQYRPDYKTGFSILWDEIHDPGSWDANPWVWVVGFKRIAA